MIAQSSDSSRGAGSRAGHPNADKGTHFELTQAGEMLDEDGIHLAFTAFRASDGVRLTAIHNEFESPLRAREYFDKEISKAKKIIKRGKKTGKRGKVVGERAQVIFGSGGSDKTTPAVLWTSGPHFHEILSDSFGHILELEKRYKD